MKKFLQNLKKRFKLSDFLFMALTGALVWYAIYSDQMAIFFPVMALFSIAGSWRNRLQEKLDDEEKAREPVDPDAKADPVEGIDLDELQRESERLLSLLTDRHPGLMTWNQALGAQLKRLARLMFQARTKFSRFD